MVALTTLAMGVKLAAEYAPSIIGLFSKEKGKKALLPPQSYNYSFKKPS